MSVRKNNQTERAIKMSDLTGNKYSCCMDSYVYVIDEYDDDDNYFVIVHLEHNPNEKFLMPSNFFATEGAFKLKEEIIVNEVEKELYQSNRDGRVYEVVFKGNYCVVLKNTMTGDESFCTVEQLSVYFHTYTKEYAKQQKKKEDLGVLANVTDEIRKLLDDNHVICHASVNRDTKGLVEYTLMLGESL